MDMNITTISLMPEEAKVLANILHLFEWAETPHGKILGNIYAQLRTAHGLSLYKHQKIGYDNNYSLSVKINGKLKTLNSLEMDEFKYKPGQIYTDGNRLLRIVEIKLSDANVVIDGIPIGLRYSNDEDVYPMAKQFEHGLWRLVFDVNTKD